MGLLRAVLTIGGLTMVSRVFGFVRDVMIAWALGAGPVSDAFFVALRLPNLFRTLFAEGAFSAAFVPVFAGRIAAEGPTVAKRYAEDAQALLLTALLTITILAEAAMPMLIPLLAFGFVGDGDQLHFTTTLTRITFPYLLFISMVALQGGVLNSLGSFAATAATPILLNLFQIAAILWGMRYGHTVEALCWGVTLAGVAQFIWLAGSARKRGMSLALPRPRLSPEMRQLAGLMLPGIFGAGVTQINLLVSTNVASMLPPGSISYLQYADRLNQLPLAVVGIAVGTAILPVLSRQIRAADHAAANDTMNRALRLALLLTAPAAAGLFVLAGPILGVLFERGHFDAVATHATASALAIYALGLPAFVLVKVLAPAFFARHDTRTPVKIATVSLVLNLVLTLSLALPLHHLGNATATTVAGWMNALSLGYFLRRHGLLQILPATARRLAGIIAATAGMAVLLVALPTLLPIFSGAVSSGDSLFVVRRVSALVLLMAAGALGYVALIVLLGGIDRREIAGFIRRDRSPAAAGTHRG